MTNNHALQDLTELVSRREADLAHAKSGAPTRLADLSEEEKNALTRELAERIKDLIYTKAEENVKYLFDTNYENTEFLAGDTLKFNFSYSFVWNDAVQIIARLRREAECKTSSTQ